MLNRAARPDAQNLLTYFSQLDAPSRQQLIRFLESIAAMEEASRLSA